MTTHHDEDGSWEDSPDVTYWRNLYESERDHHITTNRMLTAEQDRVAALVKENDELTRELVDERNIKQSLVKLTDTLGNQTDALIRVLERVTR